MDNTKNIKRIKIDNRRFFGHISTLLDKIRFKILENNIVKDSYNRAEIASSIKDDSLKLKSLELIEDDHRLMVAETIKDDKKKIEAMKYILIEDDKEYLLDSVHAFDSISPELPKLELYKRIVEKYGEENILEKIKEQIDIAEEMKKSEDNNKKVEYIRSVDSECIKAEVAQTISDDNIKLEIIKSLKNEKCKFVVAQTISDDNIKLEIIKSLKNEKCKLVVAQTIENDDIKMKFFQSMNDEWAISYVAATLKSDEKKKAIIKRLTDEYYIFNIIDSMTDDGKIELLEDANGWDKYTIIELIGDVDKKIASFIKYGSLEDLKRFYDEKNINERYKARQIKNIIKEMEQVISSKDDNQKIKKIKEIDNESLKIDIIQSITDDSKKLEVIKELSIREVKKYRKISDDLEFIKENIGFFIKKEGFDEQCNEEIVEEMYKDNNMVVKMIDFRILSENYVKLLGKDKINLISCYPDIQEQILNISLKKLDILVRCIDDYMKDAETEEWTTIAKSILNNLCNGEYDKLIEDIDNMENIDIDILKGVLQNENIFNIDSREKLEKYTEIKKEKTDIWINSEDINENKLAVLEKVFGHDIKYANEMLEKYGQDIETLPDSDIKYYIKSIEYIMKCNSDEILKQIYEQCTEINFVDKAFTERMLKNEYLKLYNEGLFKIENAKQIEEGMYAAGTDFKMIITSLGAYYGKNKQKKDYKSDWNRPAIASQHFCASYIRNDMIGTAPIVDICYGFVEMEHDSLVLSGSEDVYSSKDDTFVSVASCNEKYYTPDNQINNTKGYNEMDFRRIQNGKKKEPSYIVVFKKGGIIKNIEKAKRAQKNWGGLPIVVVDIDECLESEKTKVYDMMQEYKVSNDPKLAEQIRIKIRNNRQTSEKFCKEIDIKTLEINEEEKIQENQDEERRVTEEDLAQKFDQVTPLDREVEVGKMKKIFSKMKQIEKEGK